MCNADMIKSAVHEAASAYPIKRVDLFGSYANGKATKDSDADLLVEFLHQPVSLFQICGLQETLSEMLAEIADVEIFMANLDAETFAASKLAQKAVMMSPINIGELSKSFSAVRGLHNIAAYHYKAIRIPTSWETVIHDLPALKRICWIIRLINEIDKSCFWSPETVD